MVFLPLVFLISPLHGQGDLQYLKDNFYMENYRQHPFNCDSLTDIQVNTMTDRICENLRLQRADSVLKVRCDEYLRMVQAKKWGEDALQASFQDLQRSWREFRDAHCLPDCEEIVSNGAAANCMWCMRRITELRIEEIDRLLEMMKQ